jgi:hypothetical protein
MASRKPAISRAMIDASVELDPRLCVYTAAHAVARETRLIQYTGTLL